MKILVIGGCHCYGYGVASGKGFIQKLVTQYEREGIFVHVDYYTPYKMDKIVELVEHLSVSLSSYDLILLQIGHFELLNADKFKKIIDFKQRDFNFRVYGEFNEAIKHPKKAIDINRFLGQGFEVLPKNKPSKFLMRSVGSWKGNLIDFSQMVFMNFYTKFKEVHRIEFVRETLVEILNALYAHRNKAIVLTPFPVKEHTTNFLRKEGRKVFIEECERSGVYFVDTHTIIDKDFSDFLSSDNCHLNEFGHEVIYRELSKGVSKKLKYFTNILKINTLQEYLVFNQN